MKTIGPKHLWRSQRQGALPPGARGIVYTGVCSDRDVSVRSLALPGGSSGESFGQTGGGSGGGEALATYSASSPALLLQHGADAATLSLLPSWDMTSTDALTKVNVPLRTAAAAVSQSGMEGGHEMFRLTVTASTEVTVPCINRRFERQCDGLCTASWSESCSHQRREARCQREK